MNLAYQFTPYALPMLASAAFMAVLGVYAWHRRSVPGARPFVILMASMTAWAIGAALELAATDVPTKIAWIKFQAVWQLPATTAVFWFALEYANLDRWLTRRTIALLSIPPLLILILILTNDAHQLIWLGFSVEGYVHPLRGSGNWIMTGYGYLLALATLLVLIRQFIRSPLHRMPIALILCGMLATRTVYLLDAFNLNPVEPMDPTILVYNFTSAMYALALFRYRMFDLIPVARATMLEQMGEGMVVLDARQRIADLNPAARKFLDLPAARVIGCDAAEVLHAFPALVGICSDPTLAHGQIRTGTGAMEKCYEISGAPLTRTRGEYVGRLLLLRDVTERERTRAQLLTQQHTLAIVQERERLARELHDSLGQVLASAHLQAETAKTFLAQGETEQVAARLDRLSEMTRAANADVREYLLGVKTAHPEEHDFLATLREYVRHFGENYACPTELIVPPELEMQNVDGIVAVQLLRIIQEGLTNVRKHAFANGVQITFEHADSALLVTLADDGCGFDSAALADSAGYGLRAMRERAESVGGTLEVHSAQGAGTRLVVKVPWGKGHVTRDMGRFTFYVSRFTSLDTCHSSLVTLEFLCESCS